MRILELGKERRRLSTCSAIAPCVAVLLVAMLSACSPPPPWPPPMEGTSSPEQPLLTEERASAVVTLDHLQIGRDGSVRGRVVNQSGRLVKDVRLLIQHAWHWRDERNPGRDNPGRSAFYTVRTELEPGEAVPFEYRPSPPLPRRSDGYFRTKVEVVGFAEVGG